jgi:hypothetical protein
VQGWRHGPVAKIENRSPDDLPRFVDAQSRTPTFVEKSQPILSCVLAFTALAKAGDFVVAHQRLDAGWRQIQKLAYERGIDRKALFVSL